ncbi:TM1802 family CRISPR-associated protein [Stygiolobus caldivivus]|uniref:TIGR02556 family CRISPR-associated protein n=1 Tax=Stygiolobus caldivivus TaxID=2824673 RepID=A0A8D5ZIZ4_9CREN|nr:TM1802 family CRISPR-associated protein [Stygiolobus caldivivus]BCU70081.1 hypothetical protein KN1_13780 [Stygiolobus caldivivus]
MFKSLLRIGEITGSGSSTKLPIVKVRTKGEGLLCFVVFDNAEKKVYVEKEKLGEDDEEKYAFIDDAKGQKPQDRLTTKHLEYILGFKEGGEKVKGNKFALEVVRDKLKGGKTRQLLDEVLSWYPSEAEVDIKDDDWECTLYTVRVKTKDGKAIDLATLDDYRRSLTDYGETVKGKCQFCGSDQVLADPAYPGGKMLKVFITDKKGFLSQFGDVVQSHTICPSCKYKLEMGLNYVESKLTTNIGKLNVSIVPDLPPDADAGKLSVIEVSREGYILKGLEQLVRGERDAEEVLQEMVADVRLDLVFGESQQNKFKLWRVIPEVGVPRLVRVVKLMNSAKSKVDVTPDGGKLGLGDVSFNTLYGVLPVRDVGGKVDPKVFLEFLEAILLGNPVDKNYVYSSFLSVIRCKRYDTCTNSLTSFTLEDLVLYQEIFIYVMKELGIMEANTSQAPDQVVKDVSSYADSLGLKGGLKGLFLLGVLTAHVGRAQYNKGDQKKAILDKIDFEGMDYDDVVAYANRLMESLRDYKLLNSYTELLYSEALSLIKSNRGDLSDTQSNVFHILLGYSYQTKVFILSKAQKEEE